MISLEEKEYGKFIMFKFPWMDQRKGIGYATVDLDEKATNSWKK